MGKATVRFWSSLALLLAPWAAAQSTIGVEPPVLMREAQPGQTLTTDLRITNPSNGPVRVRVSLGDWAYDPMGKITYQEPGKLPRSASSWATFSPSEFVLEPRQSQTVRYTVQVPAKAEPGTHWSVLFFEAENPNPPPGQPLATFKVRVGHVFYLNIAPVQSAGRIAGIFGTPPQKPQDPFRIAVQYQNTGNAAQKLSGRFEVRDRTGKVAAELDLETMVILPGSSRTIPIQLVGPLPAGPYVAVVVLNYGDPERDVAGEYPFTLKQDLAAPPEPPAPPAEEKKP